jgi:hypothetical protein
MVPLNISLVGLLKSNGKISVRKARRHVFHIRWILILYFDYCFCILEEEFQKPNYPLHGINKVDKLGYTIFADAGLRGKRQIATLYSAERCSVAIFYLIVIKYFLSPIIKLCIIEGM